MNPDRSSNIIQIWFIITLAVLVGISIFLFISTNATPATDTSVTTNTTNDVSVAANECIDDPDCPFTEFCNRESRQCKAKKPVGENCNRDQQCAGATCVNGVCVARDECSIDSDCASNEFCGTGLCKQKRENNSNCARKEQCQSNYCSSDGICRKDPNSGGTNTGGTNTGGTNTGGTNTGGTGTIPSTGIFDGNSSMIIIFAAILIILGLTVYKGVKSTRIQLIKNSDKLSVSGQFESKYDPFIDEYEKKFE